MVLKRNAIVLNSIKMLFESKRLLVESIAMEKAML